MADVAPKLYFLDKQLDGHLVRFLWYDYTDDTDTKCLLPSDHWLIRTFANCRDNLCSAECGLVREKFLELAEKIKTNRSQLEKLWTENVVESLLQEIATIHAATVYAEKQTTYVCAWIYGDEESETLLKRTLAGLPSLEEQGKLLSASFRFYDFFAPH